MKKNQITWKAIMIDVSKIKPTPNNFKIEVEDGAKRFLTSIDKYGRAGAVVLNTDYTLIDGNSRWKKAIKDGEKKIIATVPNRKLTPKEFTEFSAMFDAARAGEVDLLRIKEELGTTKDFFKTWGLEIPMSAEKNLAEMEKNEKVINPTASRKIAEESKEIKLRPISLLFTPEQADEYLNTMELFYKKFKVDNVTDASLALAKLAKKSKLIA